MIKKGFTLLDSLLAMFIMSILLLITSNNYKEIDLSDRYFLADYINAQTNSICLHEENVVNNSALNTYVHFNSNGGVNKAQTISIGNKTFIIHLGTGYLSEEKGFSN